MHRAFLEGQAAHEHGLGLENDPGQEQDVIDVVMLAEALAPKKQRINAAQTVSDYGQQKKMSVSPPGHRLNFNLSQRDRKEELGPKG